MGLWLAGGLRTPFAKIDGQLSGLDAIQLSVPIAQALCAPRVILTRSLKVDGTPTVPSRWLMRLERVIEAAKLGRRWRDESHAWMAWARALTRPLPCQSPPTPHAAASFSSSVGARVWSRKYVRSGPS